MELESGVTADLVASFETNGQYVCDLELHGTEGVISFPDPNSFDGPFACGAGRRTGRDVPFEARAIATRAASACRLVEAIAGDRPERASGSWPHVVDVARGILASAESGTTLPVGSTV